MTDDQDSQEFLDIKVPMEKNVSVFNFDSIEHEVMSTVLMRMKSGECPSKVFGPVFVGFGSNEAIVTTRSLGIIRHGSVFAGVCWEELLKEFPDDSVLKHYFDWDYYVKDEVKVEDADDISLHAGDEALSFDSEAICARLANLEIGHRSLERGLAELKEDFRSSKSAADELRRVKGRRIECRVDNDDGASESTARGMGASAMPRDMVRASEQGARDNICLYIQGLKSKMQVLGLINWCDDLLAIFRSHDHFVVVVKPDNHEQIVNEINGIHVKKGAAQITCGVSRGNKWDIKHLIEKYGVGNLTRDAGKIS